MYIQLLGKESKREGLGRKSTRQQQNSGNVLARLMGSSQVNALIEESHVGQEWPGSSVPTVFNCGCVKCDSKVDHWWVRTYGH